MKNNFKIFWKSEITFESLWILLNLFIYPIETSKTSEKRQKLQNAKHFWHLFVFVVRPTQNQKYYYCLVINVVKLVLFISKASFSTIEVFIWSTNERKTKKWWGNNGRGFIRFKSRSLPLLSPLCVLFSYYKLKTIYCRNFSIFERGL